MQKEVSRTDQNPLESGVRDERYLSSSIRNQSHSTHQHQRYGGRQVSIRFHSKSVLRTLDASSLPTCHQPCNMHGTFQCCLSFWLSLLEDGRNGCNGVQNPRSAVVCLTLVFFWFTLTPRAILQTYHCFKDRATTNRSSYSSKTRPSPEPYPQDLGNSQSRLNSLSIFHKQGSAHIPRSLPL